MALPKMQKRRKKKSAASPKLRRIPHILLLVDTAGSYGRGIVEGVGRYAAENGPWSIQYEYRAMDSLPSEWLKQWRGDGIITRTLNVKQAKLIRATKVPQVELLGHPKFGIAEVRNDYFEEGKMAAEHFLDCGLRHFAYVAFGEGWWIDMCQEAFCKVLEERGYDCAAYLPPARGQNASILHEHQLPGLIDFIRFLPRPCGILTPGDLHAVRLLNVCREFDITVPEEMAILGVANDAVICETVRPTLSSLDLDARRIGYEAAKLLDLRMAGKDVSDAILIPPSHVAVRQSTNLMIIEDADVVQAMRFIRDYACSGIDVPRVADAVGLSRRVLERRFYRYLGRTPNAEILRIQIERAKLLLSRTDKTRESIARQTGFATPEYFSRAFRREVGITANAYRKKSRVSRELSNAAM